MSRLDRALPAWIRKRLTSLVERPDMWGDRESVELQVLQLLEVRALVLDPSRDEESLQEIQDSYVSFLNERFPDTAPVSLAQRLAADAMTSEFSKHLGAFVARTVQRQGDAPEDERFGVLDASRPRRGIDQLRLRK